MEKLIENTNEGDIIAFNNAKHYKVELVGDDSLVCRDNDGNMTTFYKESYQLPQNILAIGVSDYNFSIGIINLSKMQN